MKIICLNTWGGRAGKEKLLNFFAHHVDIHIFCLQEIWSGGDQHIQKVISIKVPDHSDIMTDGREDISMLLTNYTSNFKPHYLDQYGLLLLVRKGLEIVDEGDVFVHKERGYIPEGDAGLHARNIQYVTITTEYGNRTIINFHGLWNGQGKGDSEDRLKQSDNIIDFVKTLSNPYVICGDFNLLPDTESLKRLENSGLRNLIKEYGITSTRTSFYEKPVKFADYAFVSDGIKVKDFKVLPDDVSDHSPLSLEFE